MNSKKNKKGLGIFQIMEDIKIESLEIKYFKQIVKCFEKRKKHIIRQLNLIDNLKNDWFDIAFAKKTNVLDKFAERIVRQELLRGLKWDYLGIPISSDECFNLKNAIIHIDTKTQLGTERFDVIDPNQINLPGFELNFQNLIASQNQITIPSIENIPAAPGLNGVVRWDPNLPCQYHIDNKIKPTLTYFLRFVYTTLCPHCHHIQDIGNEGQNFIKQRFNIENNSYFCCPYGNNQTRQELSCQKSYVRPNYLINEIVLYCVPNGQLVQNYYDHQQNWFQQNNAYKSPIKINGDIVGISSARIDITKFQTPLMRPPWWRDGYHWNRTHKFSFKNINAIKFD